MNPLKHKTACSTRSVRPLLRFSRYALAAALLVPVQAAADQHVIHEIVPGDTLISLATTYLGDPDAWTVIRDDNGVRNPRRLMPGSEILIRLPARDVAVIFAHGNVVSIDNDQGEHAVEIGQKLAEGARVRVGENSYLSLQFADGSITRVMSNSVVQLVKVREQGKTVSRIIELERGAVDVSVTPRDAGGKRRKHDGSTFEIITPGAIAAVRGTRYDVTVSEAQDTTSSVTEGTVGVSSRTAARHSQEVVALSAGSGIPVDASGDLGTVRPLLPAPDLARMQTDVGNPLAVVLAWPEVAGAAAYQVRVGKDADMQQVTRNQTEAAPSARLTGLADGSYSVGIRAIDPDGILGSETLRNLELRASPAFPFLALPTMQQTVNASVTFDCTSVVGADGYHLQVAANPAFEPNQLLIDQRDLPACHYQASALEDGNYFWRVAAMATAADGNRTTGPFGNPGAFTVDASASTNATEHNTVVYWSGEFGQNYTAQISRDPDFSDIVRTQEVTQNSLDLYGLSAGSYYIRLQLDGEHGSPAYTSAPRIFEIRPEERIIQRTWADTVK